MRAVVVLFYQMKLSKVVIIAGDPALAEEVCAVFRAPRTYVVAIEAPPRRLEQYGVFQRDCIRVSNIVKAIDPDYLLFLRCDDFVIAQLNHSLGERRTIRLDTFDQSQLIALPGMRATSTSATVWKNGCASGSDIIVVEEGEAMARVIAENLAVAQSGYIFLLPSVSPEIQTLATSHLRDWAELSEALDRDNARTSLMDLIRDRLGPLLEATPQSVSFITKGIPYGIHPFNCPTTHFFCRPLLGISVVSGILKSGVSALRCPVVVLVDPNLTGGSETERLRRAFGRNGYLLRCALKEAASVTKARYLTEYMPCDYIFYSTHCGERHGRRITEALTASDGAEHQITYEVLRDAAASPTPGMVEVHNFYHWISIDGIPWAEYAGPISSEECIEYVRQGRGDPKQMRILSSVKSPPIRYSDSLQMHNGVYCPTPQIVGGYHHPIVFNNACSSWRLATRFATSGASAYVGTSLPVLNPIAVSVASHFAESVAAGHCVGTSLFKAQRTFAKENKYTPYLMHGFLYSQCKPPPPRLPLKLFVAQTLGNVLKSCVIAAREDDPKEWEPIFAFLRDEAKTLRASGI